ncbi:Zinc finger-type transcription factor [Trema orientale]|uniref:Zinc finger-type transcription factor n=1 Tax=Trema orientale TaxID=63057 RepID=A0A2P5AIN2_TREOI|nr:Zinc finger-type transcription factor [Trema orientale]
MHSHSYSMKIQTDGTPKGFGGSSDVGDSQSTIVQARVVGDSVDEGRLMQLCKIMEANEPNILPCFHRAEINAFSQTKQDENMHQMVDIGREFSSVTQSSIGSLTYSKPDNNRTALEVKERHESHLQPSLNMTLGTPSMTSSFVLPFSGTAVDGREQSKTPSPSFEQHRARPILPKPLKSGLNASSETNKGVLNQMRIARPPGEGRGKNQLLPRYWPRITDQELEQLSGDLNSTIVPLFEKVLSASDAGRIGRLVLPKACAEAYFPPISQSEGLPLRIQDVKGNEWTFQFRFWPNNNSRMYVLEGVTPCMQSMQLQAGDTVTFSRIDPGGKLVMGYRKALNNEDVQEAQTSILPNGTLGETSFSGGTDNLPTGNGYSGHLQTNKGSKDSRVDSVSEHLHLADGDIGVHKSETNGCRTNEDSLQPPVPKLEKKRTRNIGSKSKRLLMHSEDVLELRLTWEEAQDLLRPAPSVKPSIVTIEDQDFEEYDEPPVFGKRTIFVSRPSGGQEQWAQCDDCSKWRKLPVEVLLPPKWTCSDNAWDSSRCSCSAPEEVSLKELENLLRSSKDLKKRRTTENHKTASEREPSGLHALASAAVLGDNVGDSGEPSVGATTKHPRHRPGCTCIVCIQPPSGKGKHKPTCTCNVCMTVKRRFKTLMLRKKKRQSEREAESAQKDDNEHKEERETNGTSTDALSHANQSENEVIRSRVQADVAETSAGQIDLNCHPGREDMQLEVPGLTMMGLVPTSSCRLENYIKHIPSMNMYEQQPTLGSCLLKKATGEGSRDLSDEGYHTPVWERASRVDGVYREPKLD